jgi:hypothetical protein
MCQCRANFIRPLPFALDQRLSRESGNGKREDDCRVLWFSGHLSGRVPGPGGMTGTGANASLAGGRPGSTSTRVPT